MKRIFFYIIIALITFAYNVEINAQEKKSKKELRIEEEAKIEQIGRASCRERV